MSKKLSLAITMLLFALSGVSLAQTLTSLVHPAPNGAIVEYLLTDGSVMVQGNSCSDWWKLTPSSSGSYVKGTWKQVASLPSGYAPYATAGAVLVLGGIATIAALIPAYRASRIDPAATIRDE